MTEKQAIVYKFIDEWWRIWGFAPSIDDVIRFTGDKDRANIHRIYKKLCEHGHYKMTPRLARSIRPTNMRMRDID